MSDFEGSFPYVSQRERKSWLGAMRSGLLGHAMTRAGYPEEGLCPWGLTTTRPEQIYETSTREMLKEAGLLNSIGGLTPEGERAAMSRLPVFMSWWTHNVNPRVTLDRLLWLHRALIERIVSDRWDRSTD